MTLLRFTYLIITITFLESRDSSGIRVIIPRQLLLDYLRVSLVGVLAMRQYLFLLGCLQSTCQRDPPRCFRSLQYLSEIKWLCSVSLRTLPSIETLRNIQHDT